MKQMIICRNCRESWEAQIGKHAGEHVKLVKGKALKDFLCDSCVPATTISKGEHCSAVSIWTDRMPIPYYPWEHDYIEEAADGD